MKLKHLVISLAAALVALAGQAQQFRWGATAGVDITTLTFKQNLMSIDRSIGEQAGVIGEYMFPGIGFGIDFGALYTQRGATLNLGEREIWAADGFGRERSYLHYLEIPLNVRFKWTRMQGLEDYVAPYVFGGPTFSFLMGHSRLKAMEYAGGDLGVQCGLGFEIMRRWQVQGSYTWGMTYAMKAVKLMDFSARNRTWSIRVAYMF